MLRNLLLSLSLVALWLFPLALPSASFAQTTAQPAAARPAIDPALVPADPLAASLQLLLIEASDWDATHGQLKRIHRATPDAAWTQVGDPIPVNLGRKGLAWSAGFSLEPKPEGPTKREGDGKSPAGLFSLPAAFAYDPAETTTDMPLLHADPELVCVDDPASRYYNRVLRLEPSIVKDWTSHEDMRRKDEQYRYGLLVDHNHEGALPKGGSCIFMHVWSNPDAASSGCSSMSAENIQIVLGWLNPAAKPLLLQMPSAALAVFAERWKLR